VQDVQSVHVAAFGAALKLPLVQLVHARSVVAVPSTETCRPAAHVVHGVQTVAGSASSSHVPNAHASLGAEPPAQ
jgi:hypothetical protein